MWRTLRNRISIWLVSYDEQGKIKSDGSIVATVKKDIYK